MDLLQAKVLERQRYGASVAAQFYQPQDDIKPTFKDMRVRAFFGLHADSRRALSLQWEVIAKSKQILGLRLVHIDASPGHIF